MRGVGLVLCLCLLFSGIAGAEQAGLPDALAAGEMIRLHVIAVSDGERDQAIKLTVRDAVLAAAAPLLEGVSYAVALDRLAASLPQLEESAREAAASAGHTGDVRALLEYRDFPTREYDGVRVPAGEYMALCIELGEAQGRNWWCVLYPSLCLNTPSLAAAEQAAYEGVVFESWIVRVLKNWGWIACENEQEGFR